MIRFNLNIFIVDYMDFQTTLTERNKLFTRVNELKRLEEEAKKTPILIFECGSIDVNMVALHNRQKSELQLDIFEQDMIKRFPVESIVLEIIEDIVKKIEYNS